MLVCCQEMGGYFRRGRVIRGVLTDRSYGLGYGDCGRDGEDLTEEVEEDFLVRDSA